LEISLKELIMKRFFKHLLLCASIALLAACGSQDSTNTDTAVVNTALDTTKTVATQTTETTTVGTSPKRDLLANLALTYPGGVLPADRAAAAAEQLAQNPAALKFNASSATISSQAGVIRAQATTTYTLGLSAPVQRAQNTTLFGSYFFSIYDFEMVNALATHPTWNLEGTAFHASLGLNPGLAPVWRFRNIINGSYLYTIDEGEKANIIANYSAYFVLEGPAWYASPVPATGFSPLYRFRNLTNGTYLFSAYEAEKNAIEANYVGIFLYEGISYYVRQAAPLELSLLAGSGVTGSANGTGAAASLFVVAGMVHDSAGNMFVTNYWTQTIRKITPAGVVSTYAGAVNAQGSTDGLALTARFKFPWGITIDSADNLFVADGNNYTIRKITPAGVVSTFAGSPGITGNLDGTGASARFYGPRGITIDGANNLYVADKVASTIRKITPSGVVTTVAGLGLTPGIADGMGTAARFNGPEGIDSDATGTLYVADTDNHIIRKITPAGEVITLAGSTTGISGSTDGIGAAAKFIWPSGMKLDAAGNVYVADYGNTAVRKITPASQVSTVVGGRDAVQFTEGLLPAGVGQNPYSIDIYGGQLFIGSTTRVLKVNGLP
jgi:predicted small lipoprotein YifL